MPKGMPGQARHDGIEMLNRVQHDEVLMGRSRWRFCWGGIGRGRCWWGRRRGSRRGWLRRRRWLGGSIFCEWGGILNRVLDDGMPDQVLNRVLDDVVRHDGNWILKQVQDDGRRVQDD